MAKRPGTQRQRETEEISDERKALLTTLLAETWISPMLRLALLEELHGGAAARRASLAKAKQEWAEFLWGFVNASKARMRKNGEKPDGGRHEAAVAEVARAAGMSVSALKQDHRRWRYRK